MSLKRLLVEHGIQQRELAAAVGLSEASISRIVRGDRALLPRKTTLDAILAWLTARLGRPVTYEETFGGDSSAEPVAPEAAAEAR